MSITFCTLGCKLNQAETQDLKKNFINKGIEVIPFDRPARRTGRPARRVGRPNGQGRADFYVVNACAVTQKAEKQTRQIIRQIKQYYPESPLIVTGCFTKQILLYKDIREQVDIWVNNDKKQELVDIVLARFNRTGNSLYKSSSPNAADRTRALIKIQDGCQRFCSYCVVPYLRKNLYSKPVDEIIREIKHKQKNGFKEVVLAGANISLYSHHRDSTSIVNLVGLLEQILSHTSMPRIRLSSLWPTVVNDELVRLIKSNDRLCPHIHLSIQSACDKILLLMNRNYAQRELRRVIKKLYQIKDIGLTADIIVGFPGETNSDFQETADFVQWARFLKIHVFRFSSRKGTKACIFKNTVPDKVKQVRSRALRQVGEKTAVENRKKYFNKTLPVLFENKKDSHWSGLTPNYLKVYCKSTKGLANQIINVKLIKLYRDGIIGMLS